MDTKRYVYLISCPDEPWWTDERQGELINQMTDEAVEVSYSTMLRHCRGMLEWAVSKGYDRTRAQGLTLKDDPYVTFNRGYYDGMRCYFLQWSGMEFVWVHEDDLRAAGIAAPASPWDLPPAPRALRVWHSKEPW